jgi:hypothetical protein
LISLGAHAAGLKETPTFYDSVAGRTQNAIDEYTEGKLRPENKTEEYMDVIGEGLAPLALAPLTGGASLTGMAAKNIGKIATSPITRKIAEKVAKWGSNPYAATLSNVAGNAGSSAAMKTYVDNTKNPGLLGTLAAASLGGSGARAVLSPKKAAATVAGSSTRFDQDKYKRATDLGIPVTLANTAKGKIPGRIEMFASKTPGIAGDFEDIYRKQESAIARNLGISTPDDLEHAVSHVKKHLVKQGAEGYHKRVSELFGKRKDKFRGREEKAIRDKELIDVSGIINDLEKEKLLSLTSQAKNDFNKTGNGILLQKLKDYVPEMNGSDELNKLIERIRSGDVDIDLNKITSPTRGVGLHDLNTLRKKALNESIESKTPTGGGTPLSVEAAKRSSLLSQKRYEFMNQVGNKVEKHNAGEANKLWSQYKNEKKGTSSFVEDISGPMNDADSFNLLKKDARYFNVARQGLPKSERPKLAEAFISDLGNRGDKFDIRRASTSFNKLEAPVKEQLLKSLPNKDARNSFTKTMDFVRENKKLMNKLSKMSNDADSNDLLSHIKKYGTTTAIFAGGAFGAPAMTAFGYGTTKIGAKLWTNQDFIKLVNEVKTAKTHGQQSKSIDLLLKSVNQAGRSSHNKKSLKWDDNGKPYR